MIYYLREIERESVAQYIEIMRIQN